MPVLDRADLQAFARLSVEQQAAFIEGLAPRDRRDLTREIIAAGQAAEAAAGRLDIELDDPQRWPTDWWWEVCLFLAGRGAGKTYTGGRWVADKAENAAPAMSGALLGPTRDEIREIMIEGESGVLAALGGDVGTPGTRVALYNRSTLEIETVSGSTIYARSAERPDKVRGLNLHWAWVDEPGSWSRFDAWTNLELAMRTEGPNGEAPQTLVTGTPRRNELVRHLWGRVVDGDETIAHMTASMEDNVHLSDAFIDTMIERYGGTSLGEAEIFGRMLDEVEGALWRSSWITHTSWVSAEAAGGIVDCVIGVDPSGSAEGTGDECGIIVAALGANGVGYVVEDRTIRGTTGEWIDAILRAFRSTYTPAGWRPSLVVVEKDGNMGGLAKELLGTLDASLPVKLVGSKGVGKADRARPVATLYEQRRIRHLDSFPLLEDQMTGWVPVDEHGRQAKYSPDRIDALVWALRHLFPSHAGREPLAVRDRRLAGRR